VWTIEGPPPVFNRPTPKFRGLLAAPAGVAPAIRDYLRPTIASILG
jgi:hypothetical protein